LYFVDELAENIRNIKEINAHIPKTDDNNILLLRSERLVKEFFDRAYVNAAMRKSHKSHIFKTCIFLALFLFRYVYLIYVMHGRKNEWLSSGEIAMLEGVSRETIRR
jgi:hypothetical protein